MKKKNVELNVDFIGGQEKLTREEEIAINLYFAKRKVVNGEALLKKSIRRRSNITRVAKNGQ